MRLYKWIDRLLAVTAVLLLVWISVAHYISGDTQSAIYSLLLAMALNQVERNRP